MNYFFSIFALVFLSVNLSAQILTVPELDGTPNTIDLGDDATNFNAIVDGANGSCIVQKGANGVGIQSWAFDEAGISISLFMIGENCVPENLILSVVYDANTPVIGRTFTLLDQGETGSGCSVYSNAIPSISLKITPEIVAGIADFGNQADFNAFCIDGALPVGLVELEAREVDKKVMLNWQTAGEINNDVFQVEASHDGVSFRKIGEQEGKGTTSEVQSYSFHVTDVQNGVSYYRLKQIDFDGHFEYSDVVSINYTGDIERAGQLYPNPSSSGLVSFNYLAQKDETLVISVYDLAGKLVCNKNEGVVTGENNLRFNFSKLQSGMYVVKVGDGGDPVYRKMVIKK